MRGQRRRRTRPQPGPHRQRSGDYRIFVGAFLHGELADEIQTLRAQLDPVTAAITPPHVTLAGTYWRSGRATPENETVLIHRLQQHQKEMPPFTLQLAASGASATACSTSACAPRAGCWPCAAFS